MILKKIQEYTQAAYRMTRKVIRIPAVRYTLMLGAVLITGFLSFSGIYVLWPILPLAIAGLVLSVFEGQIYNENIKDAFEKLFKPNYLKQQLAKECLQDLAMPIAGSKGRLRIMLSKLAKMKADEDCKDLADDYEAFLNYYQRFIDNGNHVPASVINLDDFCKYKKSAAIPFLESLSTVLEITDYPKFFDDYLMFVHLQEKHQHAKNLNETDKKEKERVECDINTLKALFLEQLENPLKHQKFDRVKNKTEITPELVGKYVFIQNKIYKVFLNKAKETKLKIIDEIDTVNKLNIIENRTAATEQLIDQYVYIKSENTVYKVTFDNQLIFSPIKNKSLQHFCALTTQDELDDLKEYYYRLQLNQYLEPHREKWKTKLNMRRFWFQFVQAGSTIAGLFMMLGTSYLLVEAFTVIPFIALIPFGFWPIVVVPMALIAGTAFALLTYNAITDMINDDIIMKRIVKMTQDFKKGKIFMPLLTVSLIALAIALTICTAGTWWTVIKYTRPLFSWMGKIPSAVLFIMSAILGVAQFAFNVGNTLETVAELDQETGKHPYDLALLTLNEQDKLVVENKQIPTLVKKGDKYYIWGGNADTPWHFTELNRTIIESHVNFKNKIFSYSILKLAVYLNIKANNGHTFIPSKENIQQKLNPFRILLKLTYTPLRIALFLGHLVSIGAVGDRLPGVPEIISAILGILAEFFEDWHYFFNLEPAHKDDIESITQEHFSTPGGHDHEDDIPTKCLRFLFYPLIYMAAWWDSAASDRKPVVPNGLRVINAETPAFNHYADIWRLSSTLQNPFELNPSLSFERALEKQQGIEESVPVSLTENDSQYLNKAHENLPQELIAAENEEEEIQISPVLVKNLATMNPSVKALTRLSLFNQRCCNEMTCAAKLTASMGA